LATDLQEADISESLSALEKDLDSLLQFDGPEATARRGASGCFGTSDPMISSTSEGHFVHWKGMKPSNLLKAEDQLVAHLEPLPFQEGRPLATVVDVAEPLELFWLKCASTAIQVILTQHTSNGTTHWSVRSPPDSTTVTQDRSRFTTHEGELTITPQLINFKFTEILNIITVCFKLK
jgi:hypothetical protein